MDGFQTAPAAGQEMHSACAGIEIAGIDRQTDPAADAASHATASTSPRLDGLSFEQFLSDLDGRRGALSLHDEVALYQAWIEGNTGRSPLVFAAWFNLGVVLAAANDHANAATAYRNALVLKPDLHAAAINLGLMLEVSGHPERALLVWEQALQTDEVKVALLTQKGRLLETIGELSDAESTLRRVLNIDPRQIDVIHHWVHLRQKLCAWPVLEPPSSAMTAEELLEGSGPLGILALTDDIARQTAAAASWVERKTTPAPRLLAPKTPYNHSRIRIGYLSSDFCSHAMSYLIAELFERHDRMRFEIFGYCASPDDGSAIRQRVLRAFDRYRSVSELSDEQAAHAIRRDEIDILIDLNGLTDRTRLPVLRWRPAPIQATYLGFIGAVPLPELDFMLCDAFAIPPALAPRYAPVPKAIPRVYQANDSKRAVGRPMSRAEAGLPESTFVLCCFSRHYKVTQQVFASWMQILRNAPEAILWLAKDNRWSDANLAAAATRAHVEPDRIVFAERIDPDLYMSRLRLADLFLDTYPYNAGTVASDALRMGLPLLTLCGDAFASRMAGSLLNALGASEGITTSHAEYVAKATKLATDPAAYHKYRSAFTPEAWASTLGDVARFTADFEATLESMMPSADDMAPACGANV
jgi:predicted O-linked N-acetylglucosamine transferase (SPINDLY family)